MKDEDILTTAKERFERSLERSSHNRDKARADIRFAAASPDDPWQWDELDIQGRKLHMRPMLTINKLPQHIRQVTNDVRQNRPAIRYRPANEDAVEEVADVLMGIARHIEANSDADVAYDTASEHQVTHGLGYIRIMADYISEDSFDQDIFIRRIKDPFKVYDDPDAEDPAGADRRWLFIEDKIPEKEFKAQYPDADAIDWNFATESGWYDADKNVRVAEYFEVVEKDAELYLWRNGSTSYKGDPLPKGVIQGETPLKTRKSKKCVVMWRKITGSEILEEREFPSRYIPFARVIGNEWEVDGKTYISGLVRNAKDSQRMYNVAQSAIVERVMQAPKAPWLAPAEAVEGYEKVWQTANTANHSYLPFNHVDENGNPIPVPQRNSPATVETGLNQVAMGASEDIKAETGQYDASLGQRSNETSGRAIMARQREGDNATFHYVDNLGRAIRHIGRIILDMIPRIYDTRRVARILGEDGSIDKATLDPDHPEAMTEFRDEMGEIQRIFNPSIGVYDVYTSSGPSFATRRVEAVEAMTAMTQANPMLWQVIGDQLVKNMDWPGAEEMAERLKLTLLPQVQEEINKDEAQPPIPPQIQQAMQQLQMHAQQQDEGLHKAADAIEQKDAELRKAEIALQQEASRRLKLEIDLERISAMREIEQERQAAIEQIEGAQEVTPNNSAELEALKIQKQQETELEKARIASATQIEVARISHQPPEDVVATGNETLALLSQLMQNHQELMAHVARPKSSQVRIIKQADGSFVGEKVEG